MIRESLIMVCTCEAAGRVRGKGFPAADLAEYAAHLLEVPIETKDVPLLTDDFAPVEILRAM
jgi:hypothetical protein